MLEIIIRSQLDAHDFEIGRARYAHDVVTQAVRDDLRLAYLGLDGPGRGPESMLRLMNVNEVDTWCAVRERPRSFWRDVVRYGVASEEQYLAAFGDLGDWFWVAERGGASARYQAFGGDSLVEEFRYGDDNRRLCLVMERFDGEYRVRRQRMFDPAGDVVFPDDAVMSSSAFLTSLDAYLSR
jgi:hypothetical protein